MFRKRNKIFIVTTVLNIVLEILARGTGKEKIYIYIFQTGKKNAKVSLLTFGIILYVENIE